MRRKYLCFNNVISQAVLTTKRKDSHLALEWQGSIEYFYALRCSKKAPKKGFFPVRDTQKRHKNRKFRDRDRPVLLWRPVPGPQDKQVDQRGPRHGRVCAEPWAETKQALRYGRYLQYGKHACLPLCRE